MAALTGSCLCGGVRFEVTEPPLEAGYCHCTRCQGRTGSGSSAQARVRRDAFRFTAGEEHVRGWRHPDGGFEKFFCVRCGAHLCASSPQHTTMSVRMSAFDEDPGVRPSYRTFTDYAAAWEPIPDDGLNRYAEGKPFD